MLYPTDENYSNLKLVYEMGSYGQYNKQFTLVIYEPRVVIWVIFKSGTALES